MATHLYLDAQRAGYSDVANFLRDKADTALQTKSAEGQSRIAANQQNYQRWAKYNTGFFGAVKHVGQIENAAVEGGETGAVQFAKGGAEAVVDTVKGVGSMVVHPVDTAVGIGHAAAHPITTGKAVVSSVVQTAKDLASGDPEKIGKAITNLALMVLPGAGEARAVEKAGDVVNALEKAEQVTNALKKTEEVANAAKKADELANVVKKTDEAANVGEKTEEVSSAAENAAGDAQSLSPAKSNDENFAANRFYEGSDKHGSSAYTSGGKVVSPEPTSGQVTLDNSVRVSADPRVPSRVGVDPQSGEIAVFNRTGAKMGGDPAVWGGKQGGEFHGHVRQWNELTDPQRNALNKAGLTDKRGDILPSN